MNICIFVIVALLLIYLCSKSYESMTNNNQDMSYLNDYFDIIYAITLEKRQKYMRNFMKNNNIKYVEFEAITPQNDTLNLFNNNNLFKRLIFMPPLKTGEKGCALSHIMTLIEFLKTNNKNALILEDDVALGNNTQYKEALNNVPPDYDIVFLGYCREHCHKIKEINNGIYQAYSPLCTHAYAVSRKGAQKILEHIKNNNIYGPIDNIYQSMTRKNLVKSYLIRNPVFIQNRKVLGSIIAPKNRQHMETLCENNKLKILAYNIYHLINRTK